MKKIAFIGYKWIWKDFFQEKLAKRIKKDNKNIITKRKALGDVLKLMSSEPIHNDWENNWYLLDDIMTFLDTPILELYKNKTDKEIEYIDKIMDLISDIDIKKGLLKSINEIKSNKKELKDFLKDEEKLEIINLFKNIPHLKTRISLQTFWDYYKEKTKNTFIFSELLTEEVKKEKNIDYLFNTDTRFFSELLTFLEDDYIVFYLYHDDMFNNNSENFNMHLSELELALSKNLYDKLNELEKQWKESFIKMINLTPKKGEEGEKVLWYSRLKEKDLLKKVDEVFNYIKNKKPISEEDKKKINQLKKEMLGEKDFMKPFEDFSKDFIRYNNEKNKKNEESLKKSYKQYQEYNKKMINIILS